MREYRPLYQDKRNLRVKWRDVCGIPTPFVETDEGTYRYEPRTKLPRITWAKVEDDDA